jgi:cytochrome bd-type quinol oxidase subunit 1
MFYRDRGDAWIDEDSPTDNFPMACKPRRRSQCEPLPVFFAFRAMVGIGVVIIAAVAVVAAEAVRRDMSRTSRDGRV